MIATPTQCELMQAWMTVSSSTSGQLTPDQGQALQAWYDLWNAAAISPGSRSTLASAENEVSALGITYQTLEPRYPELSMFGTASWTQLEAEVEALFSTLPDDGSCTASGSAATAVPVNAVAQAPAPRRFSVRGGGFLLWLPGVLMCTSSYHEERDYAKAQCDRERFGWDRSCSDSYDVLNAAVCGTTWGLYYGHDFRDYLGCCLGMPPGGW